MRIACHRCLALLAALCGLASATAWAQPQVSEQELKAAFIFNFAVFTEWPGNVLDGSGRLTFCLPDDSPLRPAVALLAGKPVNGRKVEVLRMPGDADQRSRCRVWIDHAGAVPSPSLPSTYGLLTVSDGGELGTGGAVIVLSVDGEHVRFDIDTQAAEAAGLRLSSKLLRLARKTR